MPQRSNPTPPNLRFLELDPSFRSAGTRRYLPDVTILYDLRHLPKELPSICNYFGIVLNGRDDVVAAVQASKDEDQVRVSRLVVAQHLEGRGIGTALLGYAVGSLASSDEESVVLEPTSSAESFYGRLGFDYCDALSTPEIQEVWFTGVGILQGAIARRAEAGKLPQIDGLSL